MAIFWKSPSFEPFSASWVLKVRILMIHDFIVQKHQIWLSNIYQRLCIFIYVYMYIKIYIYVYIYIYIYRASNYCRCLVTLVFLKELVTVEDPPKTPSHWAVTGAKMPQRCHKCEKRSQGSRMDKRNPGNHLQQRSIQNPVWVRDVKHESSWESFRFQDP